MSVFVSHAFCGAVSTLTFYEANEARSFPTNGMVVQRFAARVTCVMSATFKQNHRISVPFLDIGLAGRAANRLSFLSSSLSFWLSFSAAKPTCQYKLMRS